MNIFEGKSPTERNKIIAAGVLGVLALGSLFFAFGPSLRGGTTRVTVTASPTPSPAPRDRELGAVRMPSQADQNFQYESTPIFYRPGSFMAPDPGRNIFAFYEPPLPTPYVPTPIPSTPFPTPVPTPTPPFLLAYVMPQSVYAGSRAFRMEIHGDKFTPDARVYFSQSPLPTTFISPQRLAVEVPANFIATEGPRQLIVQTPDGRSYSNQIFFSVQAPPRPTMQYVGLIARRMANNDTAYFTEPGRPAPYTARLNDVVGGRFRLTSISTESVVLQDVNLGFTHTLNLLRPDPATMQSTLPPPGRGGQQFPQGFPANQMPPPPVPQGVPVTVPRVRP
ncbi:MAG: hypothetical protein H0V76_06660, partial [Blastocatellia bacterium]|nr:hypothetical protein [Blastocatellia bacterium]